MQYNNIYEIDTNNKIIEKIKEIESFIEKSSEDKKITDEDIVKLRFQQLFESMKMQQFNKYLTFFKI